MKSDVSINNPNKIHEVSVSDLHKQSSLSSRLKTACICLPIVLFMIYFQFTYTLLMILVVYFSHSEFHNIQLKILKNIFSTDYYSEITIDTLMSSPLATYIFMLCPLILYLFKNCEVIACMIPISILEINRLSNFILLHKLINSSEDFFERSTNNDKPNSKLKSERVPNPIVSALSRKDNFSSNLQTENDENVNQGNYLKKGFFNQFVNKFLKPETIKHKELKTGHKVAHKNKTYSTEVLSLSMFNTALFIVVLDIFFYFVYVFPLCLGISIHNKGNGFVSILIVVVIAYQCDNGALFAGKKFGKSQFGGPVTPTKTTEGIYGGIILGFLSSFIFRSITNSISNVKLMDLGNFFIFTCLTVTFAMIGDFLESFIKRCADIKDSGNLFPGHGGLLDRIDSLTLSMSIMYCFNAFNN